MFLCISYRGKKNRIQFYIFLIIINNRYQIYKAIQNEYCAKCNTFRGIKEPPKTKVFETPTCVVRVIIVLDI